MTFTYYIYIKHLSTHIDRKAISANYLNKPHSLHCALNILKEAAGSSNPIITTRLINASLADGPHRSSATVVAAAAQTLRLCVNL